MAKFRGMRSVRVVVRTGQARGESEVDGEDEMKAGAGARVQGPSDESRLIKGALYGETPAEAEMTITTFVSWAALGKGGGSSTLAPR